MTCPLLSLRIAFATGVLAASLIGAPGIHGQEGSPPGPAAPAADQPSLRVLAEKSLAATAARRWDEAHDLVGQWVERDPLNPIARANLGTTLYHLGKLPEARRELERATLMEPKLADAWSLLGVIYERAAEHWLAVSALTRAIHLEPKVARHRFLLSNSLTALGWTEAALASLQDTLSIDPKLPDAHFNLAVLALRRTPPSSELARRHYKEALRLGARPSKEMEKALDD